MIIPVGNNGVGKSTLIEAYNPKGKGKRLLNENFMLLLPEPNLRQV